jgi:hypothetical protein
MSVSTMTSLALWTILDDLQCNVGGNRSPRRKPRPMPNEELIRSGSNSVPPDVTGAWCYQLCHSGGTKSALTYWQKLVLVLEMLRDLVINSSYRIGHGSIVSDSTKANPQGRVWFENARTTRLVTRRLVIASGLLVYVVNSGVATTKVSFGKSIEIAQRHYESELYGN